MIEETIADTSDKYDYKLLWLKENADSSNYVLVAMAYLNLDGWLDKHPITQN